MGTYRITGGTALRGSVCIHGAKNSVLPILAATLVTGSCCTIENCPGILDVETAVELLRYLDCSVQRWGDRITVDTYHASNRILPRELTGKMRGALLFYGALLSRFGAVGGYRPGGCVLGERPFDLHLNAFCRLGAKCQWCAEKEQLVCTGAALEGCTHALSFPSVGATENVLLAALSAKGETVLCNAAREPEIVDLVCFLRACGAEISGEGSSVLRLRGRRPLHGAHYRIIPDRMEAATYLAAAAATRGSLELRHVCPAHVQSVCRMLERGGCRILAEEDRICLSCEELQGVGPVSTAPYDGFPTDAQAPLMAAMATARGLSIFEETIFNDRFRHVPALCAMGAKIRAGKRCAVVEGVEALHGAKVRATDLRGGAAMVIAALSAQGESEISGTEHIQRGYEALDAALRACGGAITAEG